ncbi:MAG: ABC transporter substrate-binding protein [Methylobacteriaceae bacterium]|nr:ABC transporter substrate-binding protein [Methylobacteriaceae bacterium]
MNRRLFLSTAFIALAAASAQAQTTVTFTAYSGLFQDRYQAAVVDAFNKANPDIKVVYAPAQNSAQMLGTLRAQKAAPQTDVMIMDIAVSKAGTDEGLFEKLDEASVPALKDLFPNARSPEIAGAAVTFDNLVMIYNTDQVKQAPTSIMALADPAWKGKVVIPGFPDIQGLSLVMILDKMNKGGGVESKFEKGIEAMAPIAPMVQTWEPKPEVYAPIINGQAAIGIGWNARAQVNSDTSGGKLKAVLPAEGSVFQINTINLVKGAPQAAAAKKFINYALSPEAQKAFTESMFYGPTNAKAQIAEAAAARTAVKHMDKMLAVDWIAVAKVREAVGEQWRRKVIPLSR